MGCKFPVKKMEKSKLRLLVVEDEKKLCDMIAKSLHLAGYEVDMCNDGEQALEMIYAELYDLIVLDLNLPGVDGMEILRELRKENEETKVLILSARSQIADKVEGLDSGANDYIPKSHFLFLSTQPAYRLHMQPFLSYQIEVFRIPDRYFFV